MQRTQQPLTTVTIRAIKCFCFLTCQPCQNHRFSTRDDGCISVQCTCAGGGCGSSIRFYDCVSFPFLPVNVDPNFQEHDISLAHCSICCFQFQYCQDFNSERAITPPNGLGFNHVRINGVKFGCGCHIELVPCGLQPSRFQQLPGLGNTVFQASDLDPSIFEQAQGVTLPANLDANQQEVGGSSEDAQPSMNGHLTTDDLETSWNREDNEDQYPLTPLQQPDGGEVSSSIATQDQRQQRRHTEMISAVIPNYQHAPRERPMLPTEIDGDHENHGDDEMQYPRALRGGHSRANIDYGAAVPESSTLDRQAARTLLGMSGRGNVGDSYVEFRTGTFSNPMDINYILNFEEALEDQPASSTQELHTATSVTEHDQTDSNAPGSGSRQRPSDEPLGATPTFPQGTISTLFLGSQLRASRRRSSSHSWGSVSRPMSATSNASDADATMPGPATNLHNADLGMHIRHTNSPSGSLEASVKENDVSRPVPYRRGSVPGNILNLEPVLKGGRPARVLHKKRGGMLTRDAAWVSYLPSQPMESDPPHRSQPRISTANQDTLKAFSCFAISAAIVALLAAGLSRQR